MTGFEYINLIAAIASLLLAVLAIWLSLHFYDRSKESETNVKLGLEGIRTQTDSLERLASRLLDRLTKYVTGPKPADESFTILVELIKGINFSSVSTQSQFTAPNNQMDPATASEIVSCYMAIYFYSGLSNITTQGYLENADFNLGDPIGNILDNSAADFFRLENILQSINQGLLQSNPAYQHANYAYQQMRPLIRNSSQFLEYKSQIQS